MTRSGPDNEAQEVETLPYPVQNGSHFRLMSNRAVPSYTHYLFRFPAKFHAPIIKWVLAHFVPKGGLVLDPYNGSGTLQVEALAGGYNSIGLDIDLVATYIAQVKTTPLPPANLKRTLSIILKGFTPYRRPTQEYESRMFKDLSEEEFSAGQRGLEIPKIPNIEHWFRRYVIIDLANMRKVIEEADLPTQTRMFFLGVFASIIRRSSNADPVPVSGLEYTKEMKRRDEEGRYINPFDFFEEQASKEIKGMEELWESVEKPPKNWAIIKHGSVQNLVVELNNIRKQHNLTEAIDAVVTSPPYCSAVDYHTRHKLEAYWLRLVQDQNEYLQQYHHYIGRRRILAVDRNGYSPFGISELDTLVNNLRRGREDRAASMHSYFISLEQNFAQVAQVLRPGGTFVVTIGNSQTGEYEIDTHSFAKHLACKYFRFRMEFSYELRNRYMRYTRHNGANIDKEWVMVFDKIG